MKQTLLAYIFAVLFPLSALCADENSGETSALLTVGFVEFRGSWSLDEKVLRRSSNLLVGSQVTESEIAEARERLRDSLVQQGYFKAAVQSSYFRRRGGDDYIIRFDVRPDTPYRLVEFRLEDRVAPEIEQVVQRELQRFRGAAASSTNIKSAVQAALLGLRREGYLRASVHRKGLIRDDESEEAMLELTVLPRDPLSLIFHGNTVFSPAELLAPLHLESRTVPFTGNAVPNLLRGIRRMYQERGYFFANIQSAPPETQGDREIHQISIEEGPLVELDKVTFVGITAFTDRELRDLISTTETSKWPSWIRSARYLLSDELAADLELLEESYRQKGFLRAEVTFQVQVSEDLEDIELVIRADEGDLFNIQQIEIKWPEDTQAVSVRDNFRLKIGVGAPLSSSDVEDERLRLHQELLQLGYPNASVEASIDTEIGSVTYLASPGEHVRFGSVEIEGNLLTDLQFIQRTMGELEGEPWNQETLTRAQRALLRTGIFRTVSFVPTDGAINSGQEALTVRVDERDTGVLGVGAAINSEDGLHLTGEVGQQNLFGIGHSFVTGADIYLKNGSRIFDAGRIRGEYRQPNFLDESNTLILEGFIQHSVETVSEFSFDRIGAGPFIRRAVTEKLNWDLGYQLFEERTFDVVSDVVITGDDVGTKRYSLVRSGLQLDERDDPYNPRSGFYSSFEGRFAGEGLGSEISFWGVAFQHSLYMPVADELVWANSFRTSALRPFAGTEVIPLAERLYLGGRNSLRGFSRNKIGPRGVEGNIAGGDTTVVFNSELQLDLNEDVIGLVFLDVGQSFLAQEGNFQGDPQEISKLRYSPGFGIRYKTPIGPLSAEYGFALDREFGERAGRFNFGIGGIF